MTSVSGRVSFNRPQVVVVVTTRRSRTHLVCRSSLNGTDSSCSSSSSVDRSSASIDTQMIGSTVNRQKHQHQQLDAVVSVCTGKHCSKRGSAGVLRALQEETMHLSDCVVDVRCSGCLGYCKKGPAVHIMDVKSGNDVTCVRVDGHDFQSLAAAMYYDE